MNDVKKYADDEYLLEEIARLKAEIEEIRQVLKERQIRMNELEKGSNAAILKVAATLNKLSEQIEEAEAGITDAVARNQENIRDEIIRANKPLEQRYQKLSEEIDEKLEALKLEVTASEDKMEDTRAAVDELGEVLEEKAEKKSLVALHQRFTTMFAVGVVNLIGTIMTLALLCYLIISLAR